MDVQHIQLLYDSGGSKPALSVLCADTHRDLFSYGLVYGINVDFHRLRMTYCNHPVIDGSALRRIGSLDHDCLEALDDFFNSGVAVPLVQIFK